jgi:hypothetical protein
MVSDSPVKLLHDNRVYWERAGSDSKISDYAHWKNVGRFKNAKAWSRIGEENFTRYKKLLKLMGGCGAEKLDSMVEWGVGGGANAVVFGDAVDFFYGIDIARSSLDESRKQMDAIGLGQKYFPLIADKDVVGNILQLSPKGIDFFLSTATYQHFPHVAYAKYVTTSAFKILRPGGLALIQTRYADGSRFYATKTRDYGVGKNAIRFLSFNVNEFALLCEKIGFKVLMTETVDRINYCYYYLQKINTPVKINLAGHG